MRQGNGSDLWGTNDPKNAEIGIIYVAPPDDRESVLTAILTQEKLGRKQIVLVLPPQNKALQRPVDFDGLKNIRRKLKSQIIIVAPAGSGPAEFARQRRFAYFSSLEAYVRSLQQADPAKNYWHLPWQKAENTAPVPPANPARSRQTQPLPSVPANPAVQAPGDAGDIQALPENLELPATPENREPPPVNEAEAASQLESSSQSEEEPSPQPPLQKPTRVEVSRGTANEQIIYLKPEEDLNGVTEHLQHSTNSRIILVVPGQTQLRSHMSWRLLHARARELGKDVLIMSADRQIRSVSRAAGFKVAESMEPPASGRTLTRGRPIRQGLRKVTPPAPSQDTTPTKRDVEPAPSGEQTPPGFTPPQNTSQAEVGGPNIDPFPYMEDLPPVEQGLPPIEDLSDDLLDDPFIEDYRTSQSIRQAAQWNSPPIEDLSDDLTADPFLEDYRTSHSIRQAAQQNISASSDESLPDIEDSLPEPVIIPLAPRPPQQEKDIPLPDLPDKPTAIQPPPSLIPIRRSRTTPPTAEEGKATPPRQRPRPSYSRAAPVRAPARASIAQKPPGSISRSLLIALVALLLLLLIFGGIVLAAPGVLVNLGLFQPPPATVTITPASSTLQKTYVIAAVTTSPLASQRQVQAHLLSYTTSSQTATTRATGAGQIPAIVARGSLTIYNALHYAQTIAAGTIFTDTNGVQVISDRVAAIPAAQPPTEGSVTVPAHAVVAGASGNIPASDFNGAPCCAAGITVQNAAAFSGGQDLQNYTFVQQSDIDGLVKPLKVLLAQNGQASLKAQILSNEQLISPVQCSPTIASDHAASDKASSVTATVTETCTSEVYDQQGALSMAENLLKTDAAKNLGPGYSQIGKVITTVTSTQVIDTAQTVSLLVSAKGKWAFQFSNAQKQSLARLIAGKSEQDAQSLLLRQRGVAITNFQFAWPGGDKLPDKLNQITIVVQNLPA